MKLIDYIKQEGIADPDNICNAYAYRTYDVKEFAKVREFENNGIKTIEFAFVLDTTQPGHGMQETLVTTDEFGDMEIYEITK